MPYNVTISWPENTSASLLHCRSFVHLRQSEFRILRTAPRWIKRTMVIMKCIVCLLVEEGHGFRPPLPALNYSVLLSQSYLHGLLINAAFVVPLFCSSL